MNNKKYLFILCSILIISFWIKNAFSESFTASPNSIQQKRIQPLIPRQTIPAILSAQTKQLNVLPGQDTSLTITVKNTCAVEFVAQKYLSNEANMLSFVIDYLNAHNQPILSFRSVLSLSDSLNPNQTKTYQLYIPPSPIPVMKGAQYTIQIDIVQQGQFYFKDIGAQSLTIPVVVQ